MSFEEELSARLRQSVEGVSADADLADIEARSSRVHRRRQVLMTSGVAALVVVAIGALAVAGARDDSREPTGVPIDTALIDTAPVDTAPIEIPPDVTAPVETAPVDSAPVETEPDVSMPTTVADSNVPSGSDRAEPYLADTHEIYRRVLPNGDVFVARLSEQTFASLFDIDWRAPTGSATDCLGERAVLIGVPGTVGDWRSAWVSWGWNDDVDVSTPIEVATMMRAEARMSDPSNYDALYSLVRTASDVRQLIVVAPDGAEMDRVDVVDGLGMVRRASSHGDEGPPRLSVVTDDGAVSDPQPFEHVVDERPAECSPGEEPPRPLPPAGEQPADPSAAEAQIRQRHALLVDRSTPFESLPDDLLDDASGVAAAVDRASTGPSKNSFATATYDIDDVVFTDPTTAWFRYTVNLLGNPTPDHFGIATFDGTAWRFTRATICGDLQFYGGGCEPAATFIQPPEDPAWVAEHQAWRDQMELYPFLYECSALSQCS